MSSFRAPALITPPAQNPPPPPLVPPSRFAIAFGLTGLAGAWDAVARYLGGSPVVGSAIALLATVVLVGLIGVYVAERVRVPGSFTADFRSPVQFPFLSLPIVSAELLISRLAVATPIPAAAGFTALLCVGMVLAFVHLVRLVSGAITAQHLHGGQLLPSVAGTIVPAVVLARLGFDAAAAALLGIGLVLALLFAGLLAGAAFGGTAVAPPLRPTLAILIAPPALGGTVALALDADVRVIAAFCGLTALAVVTQFALVAAYLRDGFSPAFWSFSFPLAAAVGFGIAVGDTPAARAALHPVALAVSGWSGLAVLTAGIAVLGWATVRTEVLARRRPGADVAGPT